MQIKKVVVIGAGTMGGGIAAHCANVGLSVTLLDIPSKEGDKNAIVKAMWDKQIKLRPAPIMAPDVAARVTLGNTDDNLDAVKDADWVIEVVVEQLLPKRDLMARIEPLRKPGSVISSNTSGIPIHAIAEGLSADFRAHFLGTHFFNPPRYLKLLEVIPTDDTSPEIVRQMTAFAETVLGKTVVLCKDTPNFIANRLGSFVGQARMLYAIDNGYTVEEVDALTGPFIGNPKSATFRLNDIVGLDIAAHVLNNLYELAPNDESREMFKLPDAMKTMLANKWLGAKTNQGFFKTVGVGAAKEFHALNLQTMEYEPPKKIRFDVIGQLRDLDLSERLNKLFNDPKWREDRGAKYLIETTLPILAYAARRVPEIADSPAEIDNAAKYGFAAEMGPFEIWDVIGIENGIKLMDERKIDVPGWVRDLPAQGITSFYKHVDGKLVGVYSPISKTYVEYSRPKLNIVLAEHSGTSREIKRNDSASLIDIGDGVMCLEAHSKGNTLDTYVFDMIKTSLDLLEKDQWRGMVIGNQGKDFCLGANIGMFLMAMGNPDLLQKLAKDMQYTMWDVRFAAKPVVSAPRQRVLGGGAELSMTASRMAASAETYMGLVEIGVGLIPGWGGCKELLRRNVSPHVAAAVGEDKVDVLAYIQKVFETIAFAKVGESAAQCKANGYLTDYDFIVPNDEQLIGYAKQIVLDMSDAGYQPPDRKAKSIYAGGSRAKAAMLMAAQTLRWGGYISAHDQLIAGKLAHILAGGDLTAPAWVTEDYILDLEREAALSLLHEPKTQERIAFMLKNGKPLRN